MATGKLPLRNLYGAPFMVPLHPASDRFRPLGSGGGASTGVGQSAILGQIEIQVVGADRLFMGAGTDVGMGSGVGSGVGATGMGSGMGAPGMGAAGMGAGMGAGAPLASTAPVAVASTAPGGLQSGGLQSGGLQSGGLQSGGLQQSSGVVGGAPSIVAASKASAGVGSVPVGGQPAQLGVGGTGSGMGGGMGSIPEAR